MILDAEVNNEALLDRICEVYGFHQKIQLARHFDIAASSLQNRYTRGTVSYDFAVKCSLDTGANIRWLIAGEGPKFSSDKPKSDICELQLFTLSEGKLLNETILNIDPMLFGKHLTRPQCIRSDGKTHVVEQEATLSDGMWLVDVEGSISIRELTLLPARKLHVAGGKISFECGIDDIKTLGRVVGIYTEVN